MPEGPFGGPRPFVDVKLLIVIGYEGELNTMDRLVRQHRQSDIDKSFDELLDEIELKIFNRILDIDDRINPNMLGVRVIDQLEIRIDTKSISMDLLVQIAAIGRDTIKEMVGEEPNTIVQIE